MKTLNLPTPTRWLLILALLLGLSAGCNGGGSHSNATTDASDDTTALEPDSGSPDSADTTIADSADALGTSTEGDATDMTDQNVEYDLGDPVTPQVGRNDHTLLLEGQSRDFIVYLSSKAQTNGNAPVVFMFHGSSQDGQTFYDESHWRETADREGLIVVFPTALIYCYYEDDNNNGVFGDPGERRLGTKWNHGKLGNPAVMPLCNESQLATLTPGNRAKADHPVVDDVAFSRAMIAFLDANYSIDAKRVYATGFSNGAGFTARLALEASDVFAATHSQAGNLALPPHPTSRPTSRILSVGEKDDRFVEPLGVSALPLEESLLTDLPWFQIPIGAELTMLQLSDSYVYDERFIGGKKVIRYTFSTSTVGASNQFMFIVIEGLYHQYPNGTNHPVVAADYLWEFFKPYSLP
ncbi:MAG: hypothetical protein KC609_07160 [Myxococcales bacterium]|nr:hypothetical protein [Myxococcales bacterium]